MISFLASGGRLKLVLLLEVALPPERPDPEAEGLPWLDREVLLDDTAESSANEADLVGDEGPLDDELNALDRSRFGISME